MLVRAGTVPSYILYMQSQVRYLSTVLYFVPAFDYPLFHNTTVIYCTWKEVLGTLYQAKILHVITPLFPVIS